MKYTSVNIRRDCFTVFSPPTSLLSSYTAVSSSRRLVVEQVDEKIQSDQVEQALIALLSPLLFNKLWIIEAVNPCYSSKYSGHHRPHEQELRLSPSQFPLGTIYPAPTVGWMAPRPIASSGKLNITHVYPTKQQLNDTKVKIRNIFDQVPDALLVQGLTCSWKRLDWIFHPSHYSDSITRLPSPCLNKEYYPSPSPPGFA